MLRVVLVFCFVVTVTPKLAISDERIAHLNEKFQTFRRMCIKDNMISAEDKLALREKRVPTGPNSGCFIACMIREIGYMDDAGMLKNAATLKHGKSIFTDPEELKLAENFLHSCSDVNAMDVSDGEKGCERALLAYACLRDHDQFGYI